MKKLIRILLVTLALTICLTTAELGWRVYSLEKRMSFSELRASCDEQAIYYVASPTAEVIQDRMQSVVKVEVFTGRFDLLAGTPETSFGSGVIINSSGLILTARHIAEDLLATERAFGSVTLTDGTKLAVINFAIDPNADLALLKVDPNGIDLNVAHFGPMPQVGDPVWLVGNPCRLEFLLTKGVVSKVMEPTPVGNTIISNVMLNPGNSGGPLFDRKGRVVGIAVGYLSPEFGVGLGFIVGVDIITRDFCRMYQELSK